LAHITQQYGRALIATQGEGRYLVALRSSGIAKMNKLNRLHIRGFRRLREVDLEIRPMMVMIGANGVGKTFILDALSLLSASASGNVGDMERAQCRADMDAEGQRAAYDMESCNN
jgi:ABC-type uncharacterized transport system ATPase subunit